MNLVDSGTSPDYRRAVSPVALINTEPVTHRIGHTSLANQTATCTSARPRSACTLDTGGYPSYGIGLLALAPRTCNGRHRTIEHMPQRLPQRY